MSEPQSAAPAIPAQVANTSDAIKVVGRQIRYARALTPWMMAYAEWLTLECLERPTISQRTLRARGLARAPVTAIQLRLLEKRPDFAAYCDELAKGPLEGARAKFLSSFPTYIEAHREALDMAREAKDYKAIGALAEPVLDRVIPKKSEAPVATQVNIVLSPQQMQGLASYQAVELEVEEGPTEQAIVNDD